MERLDPMNDAARLLGRPPNGVDAPEARALLEGRRVLVTGAGGSIGSELSRLVARSAPASIVLAERSENALFEIDRQLGEMTPGVARRAALHDITNREATMRLFDETRPDIVFHAAAHKHVPLMETHPAEAVDNNLFGTVSAAEAAVEVGSERFVLVSTDKAVNPTSMMGATKRLAELYVQHLHPRVATAFAVVRFGNVLGTAGSVLEIWTRQLAAGGPLTITHPQMTRYFMTLTESARLVIQAAALVEAEDDNAGVFLLDMGDPIRIVDLVRRFAELHGLAAKLPDEPEPATAAIDVVFMGIRPGEKLHEELAFDAEAMRPTSHPGINNWILDPPPDRYMAEVLERLAADRRPPRPERVAALVRELLPEMVERVTA